MAAGGAQNAQGRDDAGKALLAGTRRHVGSGGAVAKEADLAAAQAACAREAGSRARAPRFALWAGLGALASALLASACCWLPLVLLAFGVSAAGIGGFLEAYRAPMLALAAALLAFGFYVHYRPARRCCEGANDAACARGGRRRMERASLWAASALVITFALFPNAIAALLTLERSGRGQAAAPTTQGATRAWRISIRGMTCEGCALGVRERLRALEGVVEVEVSFERGEAKVTTLADAPAAQALRAAIAAAGYEAAVIAGPNATESAAP